MILKHLNKICMPLVEWICVAGVPIFLCMRIVGFPPMIILAATSNATDDVKSSTCMYLSESEDFSSLQGTIIVILMSAFLSLLSVSLFGDNCNDYGESLVNGDNHTQKRSTGQIIKTTDSATTSDIWKCTKSEFMQKNDKTSSRGMGIVVGTHLIPLLYFAIHTFFCFGSISVEHDDENVQNNSLPFHNTNQRHRHQNRYQICSQGNNEHYKEYSIAMLWGIFGNNERELRHLKFAALGGFAFSASYLWVRLSHIFHHHTSIDRRKNFSNIASMQLCWKLYLVVIIFNAFIPALSFPPQRTKGVFALAHDISTPLLGMLHILLILCYNHQQLPPPAPLPAPQCTNFQTFSQIQGAWQDAFTPGEWMIASTLMTSLMGEFILQHSGIAYYFATHPTSFSDSWPLYLVVAHAGLVGCLLGVAFSLFSRKIMPDIFSTIPDENRARNSNGVMGMISHLFAIVGITLGCLETVLRPRWEKFESEEEWSCIDNDHGSSATINWGMILCAQWFPRSVLWLLRFLLSKVNMGVINLGYVSHARVLGYWAALLSACLPLSTSLVPWIAAENETLHTNLHNYDSAASVLVNPKQNAQDQNNKQLDRKEKTRKQRVIIARKYFHLVAILLFTPVTWLDPDMLGLSYAIAVALLMALEMIRGWILNDTEPIQRDNRITSSNRSYSNGKDNRDHFDQQKKKLSSLNQFYIVFLDEKDSSAAKGGLCFTHIALILGCAIPLWVHQLTDAAATIKEEHNHELSYLLELLPYLGILVLGIGDSAGAIGGIHFGRHRWPGASSRTFQGSFCMYISMICVVFCTCAIIPSKNGEDLLKNYSTVEYATKSVLEASIPLGIITLIEASTTQIDNLCLPIAASTLVVLVTALNQCD